MGNQTFKPIVKWAGGKSRILNQLLPFFPSEYNNYYEPFLGSGAVFFRLFPELRQQKNSIYLSDLNEELINLYQVVRDDVDGLIATTKKHIYDKEYYYHIRSLNPHTLSRIERASRMLYLNKTCFNGLWRVNSKGQFNVSFGRYKNPVIVDESALRSASKALKHANLTACSFEIALENAKPGDFLYLDPPYIPLSSTSSFTNYTKESFTIQDHQELKIVFDNLAKIGCYVALSNSNTEIVKKLYSGYNIKEIKASRAINSNTKKRGSITELLILSYPDNYCRGNEVIRNAMH